MAFLGIRENYMIPPISVPASIKMNGVGSNPLWEQPTDKIH